MRVRVPFRLDEPDDLSWCGGPCDGFEEPDGAEGLLRRAAERSLGPEGGDEVAVDGAAGRGQGDILPGGPGPFLLQGLSRWRGAGRARRSIR